MANYETLKAAVAEVIKTNGNQEITGELLQQTLISIISAVGENYQFVDIATPTTAPGAPDANVFYLATTKGTYANFANAVLTEGETAVFKWKGAWIKQALGLASQKSLNNVAVQRKNDFDDNIVLGKFRPHPIPSSTWIWTDASTEGGIVPVVGNVPIWKTSTDGFLEIPITNLTKNGALYLGVVFECFALKNVANFNPTNAYLKVNTAAATLFTTGKSVIKGNRFLFTGYISVASLVGGETLTLLLAIHANNKVDTNVLPIVAEFSEVQLFYIDTLADAANLTVADKVSSIETVSTANTGIVNKLELEKLNAEFGENKLNPDTFRYGTYYLRSSNTLTTGNNQFGCTDYIVADPAGLITSGAGTFAQGISSYAVFNGSKQLLRRGIDSNQYTFMAGDAFVVFVYEINNNLNFAKTKAVFVGTVYKTFEEYTDYKPIVDLSERVTALEDINKIGVGVNDVKNGKPLVYGDVANFAGGTISERNIPEDYLVYTRAGLGNGWMYTPQFLPSGSNDVYVKGNVQFTRTATVKGFSVLVAQTATTSGKFFNIGFIRENGDFEIKVDPAFYTVYEGFTNFVIWINNETLEGSGSILSAKFTGLQVLEYTDSVTASNIGGSTSKELFESTDAVLSELRTLATEEDVFVSPAGNKFELAVQDNGTITAIPIIPAKGAFFGNSLISGFNYGMAASDTTKDYYYRITEFIKTLNVAFTSTRNNATAFENLVSSANVAASIQNDFIAKLVGDESLVSIQLGDNVNTPEKVAIFQNSAAQLLQAIREHCPSARVVWFGMWYGTAEKYDIIRAACDKTGSKFITISDIAAVEANKSAIGLITRRGTATRTLSGVNSVTENTPTNITVNFTVGAGTYNTTLNVTSYSLATGTLTYTGEYEIISTSGVASHPGDLGFMEIANRFIYNMKLSEDPRVYEVV